jgi:catechol 2,3-dioxygenase-like lactoylglutathione lyase family enzyme
MTAMNIAIHSTFLPHNDPDASLAFYRDALGFEVRNDVGYGGMRWITVGPAGQPDTSIVLEPPAADPGITDDERRAIVEMMARGSYARIILATADLDGAFARLQASGAAVVQEPTEQPYGVRDCAFRDPAGNLSASTSCAEPSGDRKEVTIMKTMTCQQIGRTMRYPIAWEFGR